MKFQYLPLAMAIANSTRLLQTKTWENEKTQVILIEPKTNFLWNRQQTHHFLLYLSIL